MSSPSIFKRLSALLSVLALAAATMVVASSAESIARADTVPVSPTDPPTVSADALPTVQINGVVWSQVTVGNTVYATGSFTSARPAGSAAGTNETPRSNLLAFDITTGNLITSFNHSLNAQGLFLSASPDGSRVYVGGDFTKVDGVTHNHLAAFNTATGALVAGFSPNVSARVSAMAATNSTVYFGGSFTTVGGLARTRLAAVAASNGALLNWAPTADDAQVLAMVLAPDGSRVIVGGHFSTLNGVAAAGLGAVDAISGATLPFAANQLVTDDGSGAAILSLRTDGTQIYGAGYAFGGGDFEGTFGANPDTGAINFLNDCHGDTYDSLAVGPVLYSVGHAHDCTAIGQFPDTDPRIWHHALAQTTSPSGTNIGPDNYGWNFNGVPDSTLLHWYPDFGLGTYTGQGQSAWSLTGNASYIALGGEFPNVNGTAQQGLVRFAIKALAPNKIGPTPALASLTPKLISLSPGTVRLAWQATSDRDNEALTYQVVRDSKITAPIYTTTVSSSFWNLPTLSFTDTGLAPGSTHSYKIYVYDPLGNSNSGSSKVITVTTVAASAYAQGVIADGAGNYWRLGESTGATAYDWAGVSDGVVGSGVARGTPGAIIGDSDNASNFNGTSTGLVYSPTQLAGPQQFSIEAWINTTTTSGGKIVGFGSAQNGDSSSYDRHVYMDNAGHIIFGVYPNAVKTIASSGTYNDGQWHHIVATLGSAGMALYVDGRRVGASSSVTSAQTYTGYWRIGGDNLNGWDNQPSSEYFNGAIDDVAIYPTALTTAQVINHYTLSGRTAVAGVRPTDVYGGTIYDANPDIYFRLGESSGTVAHDASIYVADGLYSGGVTFGAPGAITGTTNTAVTLDGVSGLVSSGSSEPAPTVYSEEMWFKTTTTSGGKLIGYGSSQTGSSGNYDRHVYMVNSGQLIFGTWTGTTNTIESANSYNDGAWHQMVATQGPDGMTLYVDGVPVGTNPQTDAQSYNGYWRVGGDNTWGGASSDYFAGTVDEVAVYSYELTAQQVSTHFTKGGGTLANVPPIAAFTSTTSNYTASLDGTSSTDPDGTVVGWAWNFGDTSTGTGATPQHTYAAAGTYPVSLTVTDNQGATTVVTHNVTVSDLPPVAAFTSTSANVVASFDATTSTDPDGTVASYSWNFGDSSTGTGVTPQHTYAALGTYPVSLTVTDNQGATNTVVQNVSLTDQPPIAAFTATPSYLVGSFDATGSTDPDGTIASYAWNFGDTTTGSGATTQHTYSAAGTYVVSLTVTDNQGATTTVTHSLTVAANVPPVAAFLSTSLALTASFDGSSSSDVDGTVTGYSWSFGDTTSGTGATVQHTYATSGTYTVTLTVTDNQGATNAVSHSVVVSANNSLPVAAFTPTCTNLSCSFDGSGSSDAGGTITGYAWTFGDGGSGSGVSASHAYVAAGDYLVTLTVTDNHSATASSTATVSPRPAANPVNTPYATDTFNRTVSNGLGTAVVGGAWSTVGTASSLSVAPGSASFAMPSLGSQVGAYLGSVSKTDNETDVTLGIDKAATGGGVYVYVAGRRVSSTNEYDARVRFGAGHAVGIAITKLAGSSTVVVVSPEVLLTGVSYSPGMSMKVRFQATGLNPTTLRLKVWVSTATEPTAWQMVATDTTAGVQHAGSVGITTYLSTSSTNAPVTLKVGSFGAGPTAAAPTAAFSASCAGLSCNVDGSTSSDPSGAISSYQWSWGDGTITTGVTSTHAYPTAGTYRITLTVTNSFGWTNVTTKTVVVPA